MNRRLSLRSSMLLAVVLLPAATALADTFQKPTQQELSMTSLPGYPGAPAVVLFREQITRDDLHVIQHYDRIKILTEEGKKYANVELGYVSTSSNGQWNGDDKKLDDIAGRTIHPDGTIIPFTGKPYLKVIDKVKGASYQARVFSLPDVEVGSIIEYRYSTRYNDYSYESPSWYIQGELYLNSAHFAWYPTTHELIDYRQRPINSISWFPILPKGATITRTQLPVASSLSAPQQIYDLTVKDVPPQVKEDHMPPIAAYSYRVLFNFTPFRSPEDFWKSEGKEWSKKANSFVNPNGDLKSATDAIIAGAATDDAKLRKIYAAVMALENTDYTREHNEREDKANGLSKLKKADDVLKNKRGDSAQITELFVSMARAAGLKADLMLVPNRAEHFFTPKWLSFQQLDDIIAIVSVDGKEHLFDPGSRYCSYGHLAWQHTYVQGLRQKDSDTDITNTVGEDYKINRTQRVANLNMDAKGEVTGKIDLTFSGSPALHWRQAALHGDDEGLQQDLKAYLQDMLPKSLGVKTVEIKNVPDYENPLLVTYTVDGTLGTSTGKRLLMPPDLFLASAKATFPHDQREQAVYFSYPEMIQDALRINFPAGFTVEATPSAAQFKMEGFGAYNMTIAQSPTSFTTRRNFIFGDVIVDHDTYPKLRTFYSQFESNDQQSVVLKVSPTTTAAASNGSM